MTGAVIGAMIGLGLGLLASAVIEWEKISLWIATTLGPALIFSAIGWAISLAPDNSHCESPAVYVSTSSIRGCMHPDRVENLDPEVLKG